jgi:hypothetical protein
METVFTNRPTLQNGDLLIFNDIEAFIIDREAKQLARNTIRYYTLELSYFKEFLHTKGIYTVKESLHPYSLRI